MSISLGLIIPYYYIFFFIVLLINGIIKLKLQILTKSFVCVGYQWMWQQLHFMLYYCPFLNYTMLITLCRLQTRCSWRGDILNSQTQSLSVEKMKASVLPMGNSTRGPGLTEAHTQSNNSLPFTPPLAICFPSLCMLTGMHNYTCWDEHGQFQWGLTQCLGSADLLTMLM